MKKKRQLFQVVDDGFLEWKRLPAINAANALQYSIEKWEFLVEWLRGGKRLRGDGGCSTCALCSIYYNNSCQVPCMGCPVQALTGKPGCRDTPYYLFSELEELKCSARLLVQVASMELNFLRAVQQGQPRE